MIKKLGNQGFAITGILYSLFILFLTILLSVLAGLSSRKNMLEISNENLEQSYLGVEVSSDETKESVKNGTAPVTGKYIFELNDGSSQVKCVLYLNKGDETDSESLKGKFVPNDCNDYTYTITFNDSTSSSEEFQMNLKEIYSFEEE